MRWAAVVVVMVIAGCGGGAAGGFDEDAIRAVFADTKRNAAAEQVDLYVEEYRDWCAMDSDEMVERVRFMISNGNEDELRAVHAGCNEKAVAAVDVIADGG